MIGGILMLGVSVERHATAQGKPASDTRSVAIEETKKLDEKIEKYFAKGQHDAADTSMGLPPPTPRRLVHGTEQLYSK